MNGPRHAGFTLTTQSNCEVVIWWHCRQNPVLFLSPGRGLNERFRMTSANPDCSLPP